MSDVTREQLEGWWTEATSLDDALESPLTMAIITEALEGGGQCRWADGTSTSATADRAIAALDKLKEDIENFSARIFDATINPRGGRIA